MLSCQTLRIPATSVGVRVPSDAAEDYVFVPNDGQAGSQEPRPVGLITPQLFTSKALGASSQPVALVRFLLTSLSTAKAITK